jgi:hypothetical protein
VERVVGERTKPSARKTLWVARLIPKCGEHALEEEYLDPSAKESMGLRLLSQRQNRTGGSSAASTPQRKDEPIRVALRFVFESARFQLDSTKSSGACSFLSRRPGCGLDDSTVHQRHYHDQGTALRSVRRLVFPAPKETQQMPSRSLKRTPEYPATRKAWSPSQIAS